MNKEEYPMSLLDPAQIQNEPWLTRHDYFIRVNITENNAHFAINSYFVELGASVLISIAIANYIPHYLGF